MSDDRPASLSQSDAQSHAQSHAPREDDLPAGGQQPEHSDAEVLESQEEEGPADR